MVQWEAQPWLLLPDSRRIIGFSQREVKTKRMHWHNCCEPLKQMLCVSTSAPAGPGLLPGRAAPWGARAGWSRARCRGWWTSLRTPSVKRWQSVCHQPRNIACLVACTHLPLQRRDALGCVGTPAGGNTPSSTSSRPEFVSVEEVALRGFPQKLISPLKWVRKYTPESLWERSPVYLNKAGKHIIVHPFYSPFIHELDYTQLIQKHISTIQILPLVWERLYAASAAPKSKKQNNKFTFYLASPVFPLKHFIQQNLNIRCFWKGWKRLCTHQSLEGIKETGSSAPPVRDSPAQRWEEGPNPAQGRLASSDAIYLLVSKKVWTTSGADLGSFFTDIFLLF